MNSERIAQIIMVCLGGSALGLLIWSLVKCSHKENLKNVLAPGMPGKWNNQSGDGTKGWFYTRPQGKLPNLNYGLKKDVASDLVDYRSNILK